MKRLLVVTVILLICLLAIPACSSPTSSTPPPTAKAPAASTPAATSAPAVTSAPAPPSATTAKPPASTSQSPAPTTSNPAAGQPKSGGNLRVITAIDPGNWGWPPDSQGTTPGIQNYCYENLIDMDFQGKISPRLATSWTVGSDNKSLTFALRKNVKFHDGTDFNAQAVKFNFDAMIAAKRVPNIVSVDVVDDYNVRFNLTQFTNITWYTFYGITGYIVSPTAANKNGIDYIRTHMVGTGPFAQVSYQRDVSFKANKFKDYWQTGKPYLDSVEELFVPDLSTEVAAMKSGSAEVWDAVAGIDAYNLGQQGYTVQSSLLGTTVLVPDSINPNSPLTNPKLREAIEYAIDKDAIGKAFGYGYWGGTNQMPPSTLSAYDPNFVGRKYDPAKATQILKDAGISTGVNFRLISGTQPDAQKMCLAIQANLASIGIKIDVETPQNAKYVDYRDVSGWQNALFLYNTAYYANYNQLYNALFVSAKTLVSMKKSDAMMKAINDAISTPDFDVNKTRAIGKVIFDEAALIPIANTARCWVYPKYVKDTGYFSTGLQFIGRPENTWLDK
jgi:peptide/nickel transport system substrate-binding protein